jgi:hypothetical protein
MICSGDFGDFLDFVTGSKKNCFGAVSFDFIGRELGEGHDGE